MKNLLALSNPESRIPSLAVALLLASVPGHAAVSRQHGPAVLGMRLAPLKASVPGAVVRDWQDITLVEWDNPRQPDVHVCAQSYKERVYRIVVVYDPKYGRTRFDDFMAFVRFNEGKRPRWTKQARQHRTVGVWQDTRTRLELWEPGRNTASYTAVYFDLRNSRGLLESQVRPESLSWRACGGDQP